MASSPISGDVDECVDYLYTCIVVVSDSGLRMSMYYSIAVCACGDGSGTFGMQDSDRALLPASAHRLARHIGGRTVQCSTVC
jgi:hypothetical protein